MNEINYILKNLKTYRRSHKNRIKGNGKIMKKRKCKRCKFIPSKINFYDQPPKDQERGVVHHLGIETEDIEALVAHMKSKGFEFRKPIKNLGVWKYVMAEGPDHILLELFEVVRDKIPEDQYKLISLFQ